MELCNKKAFENKKSIKKAVDFVEDKFKQKLSFTLFLSFKISSKTFFTKLNLVLLVQ